jgi:hypothetical protein
LNPTIPAIPAGLEPKHANRRGTCQPNAAMVAEKRLPGVPDSRRNCV